MGPCEHSVEPACVSPRVFVADGVEEVVDDVITERIMECVVEPHLSLEISSLSMDGGGDDSGVKFVGQECGFVDSGGGVGELGMEDGSTIHDCHVPDVTNSEASIERADLECGDCAEEVVCDALGEKLDELVLVPTSGLDISLQASQGENDTVLVSNSVEGLGVLDHSTGTVEGSAGSASDFCPTTVCTDTDFEPIHERHAVNCDHSDNNSELGNALDIKSGLKILSNLTIVDQLPSGIHQNSGVLSGSAVQCMSETKAGCGNYIAGTLGEAVCTGTRDDRSSKSLVIQDAFILNGCVAAPNFSHAIESYNNAGNTEKDNADTDGNTCEPKCLDAYPLPLRRSSRSRKSIQQGQSEKRAAKRTKKASKVSLCRAIDFLSEATRKKRSSLTRPICSSGWGMTEKMSKYFQQSKGFSINLMTDQRSRKNKASKRNRRKNKLKEVASSQLSDVRQDVPHRPIRLKVTFGKKEEPSKVDGIPPVMFEALSGFHPGNEGKELDLVSYIDSSRQNVMDSSAPKEMPGLMQCSNSTSNAQFAGSNLDICSVSGKCNIEVSSQLEFEKRDTSCADKFSDPGTSPDSEVIDQALDSVIRPATSGDNACPRSHSFPASSKMSKNRRNNKDKLCQAGNPVLECQRSANRDKLSKKGGQLQKVVNDICSTDKMNADENPPSKTSGSELVLTESLPVVLEGSCRAPSLDNGADINTNSNINIGIESANSGNSCQLIPPSENQGKRKPKGSRSKGKSRNKSKIMDGVRNQKESSSQQKSKNKLTSKHKVTETGGILSEAYKIMAKPGTVNHNVVHVGKADSSNVVPLENACFLDLVPTGVGKQALSPRVAWVCCDECLKWRCIPAELADAIEETNCKWTCKDNQDQACNNCSIPQVKSNAEINAELQISDEEDARDGHLGSKGSGTGKSVASQPSTWMLIKSNMFLHRSRKAQTMDEIMVCHCKPPVDGRLGCGSQCLNRMLNIECVQGTCPCGDLCSNQLFQKQQYVMLSWFRCGKKGYGLQVLENIFEGQFLIEYVGEVLDLQSYEARQKDYAAKGHKHFYFMTLNGNEVIDASVKGNLGRFVNHSCDPNCRTEKWVVNGEICVGLFASRNIKKGEELTFDYNYVRVFGAAAKKCHCGSHKCRGYIGGDPANTQNIVQGDSDEEFPEPVVIDENGKIDHSLEDRMAKSSSQDVEQARNGDNLNEQNSEVMVEAGEMVHKIESLIDAEQTEAVPGKDAVHEFCLSTDSSSGLQPENMSNEPISAAQNHASRTELMTSTLASSPESDLLHVDSTVQKSISGSTDSSGRVSEVHADCKQPHAKPRSRMKISRPSKSIKNRKFSSSSVNVGKAPLSAQRPKILSYKPKKLLEGSVNGHLEAVEEKLNELLDADGGICKKKDASKGYLKLLLLTAASGDSGDGGGIQSNRDLSMILDAILKTKSRGVLLDIINKNGLQMLHNMMKLYRSDFKKIPILRKLLKVLEFLADKEILTVERINVDSLHPGVESLRESILFFTNHKDNQVYQIARNFRDRWIPRRINRMEKFDRRREFRRGSNSNRYLETCHHWREQRATETERITCSDLSGTMDNPADGPDAKMQEASCSQVTDSQTIVSKHRKRKSRWDQPADSSLSKYIRTSPKLEISEGWQTQVIEASEERDCSGSQSLSKHRGKGNEDTMQNSDDDAPPGFSFPHDPVDDSPPGFSSSLQCPLVSLGLLQERFNPRLPVAYGIPLSVVLQSGTLRYGTVDSWAIAPAMPFQPYPPLPPYPRDRKQIRDQEGAREGYCSHASEQRDQGIPSTSGAGLLHAQNTTATNQNVLQHERGLRSFPGRKYNRQKKWNNQKPRPPWLRNLDGWGFKGEYPPHPRNVSFDINMETVAYERNDQHLADVNQSVEYVGNSC